MKKLSFSIFILLIGQLSFAANILVVGDSHTAGPFGKSILSALGQNHNVAVYGHSSSAAVDWIKTGQEFSGGVYHGAFIDGVRLRHPSPVDWRTKVATPFYADFMENMLKHPTWSDKVGKVKADVAVIALGANDYHVVNSSQSSRDYRQQFLIKMLELVEDNQMQCFWVGPPDSTEKDATKQSNLYDYLTEAVSARCKFFSSRHYVAKKWLEACDGVHFSCNSESRALAKTWAQEVTDFINENLN